jgi:hypothetical protein
LQGGPVPAETIIGVLAPANIPQLPFTRLDLTTAPRLLGRTTSGAGPAEEIRVAPGLVLTNGILSIMGLGNGYVIGDLLYADSANSLARLADVAVGSYLRSGGVATAPLWSTLKLPDAATSGDILKASSANTYASVAPAALSKVDDTNVTLTLGGSPLTALVNAASLTLGWTGTLSVARGGTGTGTAFTPGSVIFAGASGVYAQDNANLFWADSTNRLGIRTPAPSTALQVGAATDTVSNVIRLVTDGGTAAACSAVSFFLNGVTDGFLGYVKDAGNSKFLFGADPAGYTTAALVAVATLIFDNNLGNVGIGQTAPTAKLHIKAGTATANTAPLKFTSGTLLGTAEAGAVEFLTDDYFATITTGAARKAFVLDDGTRLTATRLAVATTNGRLVNGPANAAGVLTNDGAGVLSWVAAAVGTVTGSGTAGQLAQWSSSTAITGGIVASNVALLSAANVFTADQSIAKTGATVALTLTATTSGNANIIRDVAATFSAQSIYKRAGTTKWSVGMGADSGTNVFEWFNNTNAILAASLTEAGSLAWGGGAAIASSGNVALLNAANTFTAGPQTISKTNSLDSIIVQTAALADGFAAMQFKNAVGQGIVAVSRNAGGDIFTGSEANALAVGTLSNTPINFGTNGVLRAVLSNAGAWRWAAYGAGAITSDASGNLTAVSDARLKDRIAPLPYGLAEVLALRPVQHGYNELSALDRDHLYGGFIAQDVQAVMPLAVGQDARGYLTLADRPILGAVVHAVQALHARLSAREQGH